MKQIRYQEIHEATEVKMQAEINVGGAIFKANLTIKVLVQFKRRNNTMPAFVFRKYSAKGSILIKKFDAP